MGFSAFHKYGQAFDNGKVHYQYVTKATTPVPGAVGYFVDMNQTSGQPKYNAFAGTQAAFNPLIGEGNAGVYPGPFGTGNSTKHLIRWQCLNINTSANTRPPDDVILSDYLGFYPLIDCDDLDQQILDNTNSLPRYANGDGVRIAFIVQAPMVATAAVTVIYTNSAGVANRSVTFNVVAGANIGVCATSSALNGSAGTVTPFLPLADGDVGVRSIQSIQFAAGAGGFICAALVKPLASMTILEPAVPVEKNFGIQSQNPPEIKPGAYLNFMIKRAGNGAGSLRSELIFINS